MINRSLSPELLEQCREQRKNPTKAEALLWESLRGKRLAGYKFRRQHSAGGYILDFYCPAARLGIEVDGGVHRDKDQADYDHQRSEDLAGLGVEVIRFWNSEVLADLEGVVIQIQECVEKRITTFNIFSDKEKEGRKNV